MSTRTSINLDALKALCIYSTLFDIICQVVFTKHNLFFRTNPF
nr:MAG TPA: hypothetical protein [Caudoviricetes sp.]